MFQLFAISFILLCLIWSAEMSRLTSLSSSSKLINNNKQSIHNFIVSLVSTRFSNCSLIIVEEENLPENDNNFHEILLKTLLSSHVIKFHNSSRLPIEFPVRLSNIRRYSFECKIALIFISQAKSQLMNDISSVIAPTFVPIIRKDEDHYIFISNPDNHKKILLMDELPHRVKFKIAIGQSSKDNLVVSTVNFFGGQNARPDLIQLPSEYHESFEYFPDFLWNLHGATLQVTIPYTRSKVEADPPWEGINNGRRGNWLYLLDQFLMVKFNFTYHMFVSTGLDGQVGAGGTGIQLANGTWIGVTGDLLYRRADLGLTTANTDKRLHYIDFTDTIFDFGCLTFVTGQPSKLYSPLALFWPFAMSVWAGIISACVVAAVFFYGMYKFTNFMQSRFENTVTLSIAHQINILLCPFIEQDAGPMPFSIPLRTFISFWTFFTIVVTTLYRSKLVTLMAFPVLGQLPTTFEELAFSSFKVGFMKHGDSAYNTFAASSDPVYVKFIREMEVINGVGLECLEKIVTQENYGCIAYDFAVVHLRERNFSDEHARQLVNSGATTYNIFMGVATEAKSIYRINFGKAIAFTRPFHLADIWDKMDMYKNVRQLKIQWWKDTNQTHNFAHQTEENDNLTLKHLKGAFLLLFSCYFVCTGAFLFEKLRFWKNKISLIY